MKPQKRIKRLQQCLKEATRVRDQLLKELEDLKRLSKVNIDHRIVGLETNLRKAQRWARYYRDQHERYRTGKPYKGVVVWTARSSELLGEAVFEHLMRGTWDTHKALLDAYHAWVAQ